MQVYRRTVFSLIVGVIGAPFAGLLVFIITQIFIHSTPICAILGIGVAALVVYMTVFSENIFFELDDDGTFRYFKQGALKNTFTLPSCRVGYHRKSESSLFGNNYITLKILDAENNETDIDTAPLGVTQFHKMFEDMEKFSIKDVETLDTK
jgi:hypothetical protein